MLCSIRAGKSAANWLDRLRSNKGFPAADQSLDLDHFLNNNDDDDDDHRHHHNSGPNSSGSPNANVSVNSVESARSHNKGATDGRQVSEISSVNRDKERLSRVMTNVLSDLFNMGDNSRRLSQKKCSRKQANPKFCDVSTPAIASASSHEDIQFRVTSPECDYLLRDENVLPDNKDDDEEEKEEAEKVTVNSDCRDGYGGLEEEEEEEARDSGGGGGVDRALKRYSKSEVTVIDTSCEVWKFDKLVFRKKNVWKVRDKKGRPWTGGSKKRTKNDLPLRFGDAKANALVSNKKAKLLFDSQSQLGASKDIANGGYSSPSVNVQKLHENVEIGKERPDDLSQVAKKRSPRKIRKGRSSAILIKDIPTSKKSGRKDSQRQ